MDPDVSRECLSSLLSEQATALCELEELLRREHATLGADDLSAIDRATRLRQEKVGALAQLESQRRSLCTMHGHSADASGLENLLRWCDPQSSLQPLLMACAQGAVRCRDLNDRNGVLVGARLQHIEKRLAALTGQSPFAVTYGPRGSAAAASARRVLGAA